MYTGSQKVLNPGDIGLQDAASSDPKSSGLLPSIILPPEVPIKNYACSAVHGFFRSITLSLENSTLRSVLMSCLSLSSLTNWGLFSDLWLSVCDNHCIHS